MSDESVNVKFGGSTEELNAAAQAAKELVSGAVEGMTEELKHLGGIGEVVTGIFTAMVAVFSVEKIKEGLESVVKEAEDVNKFATTLGITTEKASELNMTLSLLNISNDTYSAAILGLTRNLRNNQAVFEQNGIAIKDNNGKLLDSGTILSNTIGFLNGMKDGTERNLAAQALMGRGWRQLTDLQRINNEASEKGAKFAKELGQILGQENVEAVHRYNTAMKGINEVQEATVQVLGEAFMPLVTSVGEWFMDIGPTAVGMFRDVIDTLMTVLDALIEIFKLLWSVVEYVWNSVGDLTKTIFGNEAPASLNIFKFALAVVQEVVIGFKLGVQIAFNIIKTSLQETANFFLMFGDVVNRVLHFDFDGAKAAFKNGMAIIRQTASDSMDQMIKDAEVASKQIYQAFNGKDEEKHEDRNKDKNTTFIPKGKKGKETNRISDWKAEFEEYKIMQADYFKDYTQDELTFWENKLATQKLSHKEYIAVEKEIYTLRQKMAKDALADQIGDMNREIQAHKENLGFKVQMLNEEAALYKEKYGERSKEYKEALAKVRDAEEEFQDQNRKVMIESLDFQKQMDQMSIDEKRQTLSYQRDLGQITEVEELEALRRLKEEEYQIELKHAQDVAALKKFDVVEYQKAQEEILSMAKKHQIDMDKINGDITKAQVARWKEMFEPISSAFEKSFMGVIQGTLTLRKAMTQMLQSIILGYAQMGVKTLTNWIATQMGMTQATVAGVEARNAAEATGQSVGLAQMAATALKTIGNYAAQTFAAIYQALAGIPFVGPYLAPAAAAGGMATVMSVAGNIQASAAGGYDIPSGVNPVTQLHEQEMVLPKEQANAIRDLANGGGAGKIVINTTGGDFIHKDQLAKLLRQMNRNFVSIKS